MADFILAPIDVDGTDRCLELRDATANPDWWWTDATLDAQASVVVADTKWDVQGVTTGAESAAVGIIGPPAWGQVDVDVGWSIASGSTPTAILELVTPGGTSNEWTWNLGADGRGPGSTSLFIDITGLGACGGYLHLELTSSDNSDSITMEIIQFI